MVHSFNLSKMPAFDHTEAFLHYKAALMPTIEEAFGWDEEFQKDRFRTKCPIKSKVYHQNQTQSVPPTFKHA